MEQKKFPIRKPSLFFLHVLAELNDGRKLDNLLNLYLILQNSHRAGSVQCRTPVVGTQLDSPEVARVRSHAHRALHLPRREFLPAPSARETNVQGFRATTATIRPSHLLRSSSEQVRAEVEF